MVLFAYLQQGISTCLGLKQLSRQGIDKQKQLLCDVFTVVFGENCCSRVCSGVSRKPTGVADFLHVGTEVEREDLLVKRVAQLEALDVSAGCVNDAFEANSGEDTGRSGRNCHNPLRFNEKFLCIFGHSPWRLVFNSKRKHHCAAFPKMNLSAFRTYGQRVFVILKELKEVGRLNVSWVHRPAVVNRPFDGHFLNNLRYRENF